MMRDFIGIRCVCGVYLIGLCGLSGLYRKPIICGTG